MALTIAELPFREREVLDLLALDQERDEPALDYAGYGWARVERLWLATHAGPPQPIEDALVLGVHSADDGEAFGHDIELEFELEGRPSVTVLASMFLERWIPRLPSASAVVLAMCNPHRATLRRPGATVAIHYALGDVESWLELDEAGDRIRLTADTWCTLRP